MATKTTTGAATRTPAKPKAKPADTYRLTVTIRGAAYVARPIPNPDGRAWRLRHLDTGKVYDVAESEHGPACDCGDATFRHAGGESWCKHVRALAALGLIDLTRESEPATWPAWTDAARYAPGR